MPKKRTIIQELYEFDELSEKAQRKAIKSYIRFLLDVVPYEDFTQCEKKVIDEMEKRKTPWFIPEALWDSCRESILPEIESAYYDKEGNFIETR